MSTAKRRAARLRRHARIRRKIAGTPIRPRLNVYRSTNNIYAQIIDDEAGQTLVSASTVDRTIAAEFVDKKKKEQATVVGQVLAERALAKGIDEVVFDRGGYLYHGRVRALAEGARAGGLKF